LAESYNPNISIISLKTHLQKGFSSSVVGEDAEWVLNSLSVTLLKGESCILGVVVGDSLSKAQIIISTAGDTGS